MVFTFFFIMWFFRKDLNLNKKWRHRLLKVVFWGSLCIPIYISLVNLDHEWVYLEVIDTLQERMRKWGSDDWLYYPLSMKQDGEYISESCYDDGIARENVDEHITKIYEKSICSLDWSLPQLSYIKEKIWLPFLSLQSMREYPVPPDIVMEDLIKEPVLCMTEDSIYGEKFLNHQWIYNGNRACFAKMTWYAMLYNVWHWIVRYLLFALIVWWVIAWISITFYYKVFLYIIYGKNK